MQLQHTRYNLILVWVMQLNGTMVKLQTRSTRYPGFESLSRRLVKSELLSIACDIKHDGPLHSAVFYAEASKRLILGTSHGFNSLIITL